MKARLRRLTLVWAVPVLLGAAAAIVGSHYLPDSAAAQAAQQSDKAPAHFAPLDVTIPTSAATFPPGQGSDIANANCLICHSAGMALRQPPLTEDEWRSEINKMKSSFGAPIPADQIDELAHYLRTIDGRDSGSQQPSTADGQSG
jgi:mono/diheme cytochrome c family protein